MKYYAVIAGCLAALAGMSPAFGADADLLAARAALGANAMAAISGARSGADDPQDGGEAVVPTLAGLALPVASTAVGAAASAQAIGNGNAVASAVLLQTLSGPAAP